MFKKIISAAFATMMLISVPMFAQTSDNGQLQKKECKGKFDKKNGMRQCKDSALICPNGEMKMNNEFEGITLTETQKTQIADLKAKQREAAKARREAKMADRKADKEKKMADRKAMKEERQADRRAYLKEMKNILGNDNYVIFLENQYVQDQGRPMMQKDMRKGGPRGDFKAGKPGDKGHFAKHDKNGKSKDGKGKSKDGKSKDCKGKKDCKNKD